MSSVQLYTDLDCVKCTDRLKKVRGCEGPAPVKWWTDVDGELRDRCPRRPIFENISWYNRLISAHNAYEAGFLPHGGGMENQAALFPEIMSTIKQALNACEKAEQSRGNKPDGTMRLGMT